MKKFFSLLIFSISFIAGTFAQTPDAGEQKAPDPKEMAQSETDKMKKGLILTDTQAVQVQAVNVKFAGMRMETINEVKASGDFSQIQNKVDGLELARTEMLRPILTEEQMKKWPKLRQRMQNEMMNRGNNGNMHHGSGMRGGGMRPNDYGVNHQ